MGACLEEAVDVGLGIAVAATPAMHTLLAPELPPTMRVAGLGGWEIRKGVKGGGEFDPHIPRPPPPS